MKRTAELHAAVARANITPPIGIEMSGFAGRGRSVGLGDDLLATALVLKAGRQRVALVALDLLYLDAEFVRRVCDLIARRTRIPADHVLLCCTHTHYGPETGGHDGGPARSMVAAYMADLRFKLVGVVREANANLKRATASVGCSTCDIGINRRERQRDGSIRLGQNPEGPVDRQVIVLRVDRPSGEPVACMVNFACHAVSQTHRGRLISADFPGYACDVVTELTGAECLYLQGACGNINPVEMKHGLDTPERLGNRLGAAAVQAYETAEPIRATPIAAAHGQADLPAKTFASLKEARRAVADLDAEMGRLKATRAHRGSLHWCRLRLDRARTALGSLEAGEPLPPVEAGMWAVRLGELGIATAPGEIFCEIGQAVKGNSRFAHTMFVGYTNGSIGYVPVPEAYPEGGYEVSHASRVGPDAAGIVTDTALRLLRKASPRTSS